VEDAQQALVLIPGSGSAYRILGDGKLALEDFKGAQEAYTAAIEQDVRNPSVYAGRAYALQRQGLRTGALADYQQAVDLGVADPLMLKRYGFALYDAGEYEDSLTVFTQAINGGLDTADGYAGYSIALDANIHRGEAEEAYQRALDLDDGYSLVVYLEEQPLWSDLAITRAVTILRRLDIDPYREENP
jgi:Tfp pilus assembly protein PilF